MSHITIIIGSGGGNIRSEGTAETTVSYTPDHSMSWEEIGKEVERIEKKVDSILDS